MAKRHMQDSFESKGKRRRLVEELKKKGIDDELVLEAIGRVPRHAFMDPAFLNHAYQDKAFPISSGQTISQPYTVAVQTSLLQLKRRDKVLEVGTGSGYQAAVLLEMGVKVYTIERYRNLYLSAMKKLRELDYQAHFFYGDGYAGKPQYGPYQGIVVTAAAPEIPEKLPEQLALGGRMVVPVGPANRQEMTCITRVAEDRWETTKHGLFVFVPLLKGTINT